MRTFAESTHSTMSITHLKHASSKVPHPYEKRIKVNPFIVSVACVLFSLCEGFKVDLEKTVIDVVGNNAASLCVRDTLVTVESCVRKEHVRHGCGAEQGHEFGF